MGRLIKASMLAGGLSALVIAAPVAAEVRTVERDGFAISIESETAASPDAVFAALIRPREWWNGAHSWSGDAANLSFEPRVGGCWCETLPGGGGVEHGRIVSLDPAARTIVMDSLLGPLRDIGQAGRLTWRVEAGAGDGRSRIRWTYRVSHLPTGNAAQDAGLAAAVDRVLTQQVARLAALAAGQPLP